MFLCSSIYNFSCPDVCNLFVAFHSAIFSICVNMKSDIYFSLQDAEDAEKCVQIFYISHSTKCSTSLLLLCNVLFMICFELEDSSLSFPENLWDLVEVRIKKLSSLNGGCIVFLTAK